MNRPWTNSPRELLPLHLCALAYAWDAVNAGVRDTRHINGVRYRSPEIDTYLRTAGVPVGNPYCAAFVYTMVKWASDIKGVPNPLIHVPLKALVQSYFNYATNNNLLIPFKDVGPGDIILFRFGGVRWDHMGLVDDVKDRHLNVVWTVEGNTSAAEDRTGGQVQQRRRTVNSNVRFMRYCNENS